MLCLACTFGAWTIDTWPVEWTARKRDTHHRAGNVYQCEDLWPDDPVIDIPPVPLILDQSGIAQDRQLLRDIRLTKTQMSFNMANTLFTIAQYIQDGDPSWMRQGLEQGCQLVLFRLVHALLSTTSLVGR